MKKPEGQSNVTEVTHSTLRSIKRRALIVLAVTVLYLVAFPLLHRAIGNSAGIFSTLPVVAAAWYFGARVGVLAGLATYPVHLPLVVLLAGQEWRDWAVNGGLIGSAAEVLVGYAVGRLRDLRVAAEQELLQRTRVEHALRASEERFELAVKGSTDGMWDWPDVTKNGEWWSPRWYELLGYADGEVEASYANFGAFLHPDDLGRMAECVRAHFEQRVPFDMEYRLRTKSGEYRWFRGRGQALWDEDGNARRMSGSIQDIHERKQAEQALRASEERYRGIFESAINMIHVVDDQYRITDVNETELRKLGYSRSELIGKPLMEIVHPEFRPVTTARIPGVRSGEVLKSYETAMVTKDGNKISVAANVVPVMVEGRFRGAQAILQDITERKHAEEALSSQEELYRTLVEKIPDIIWVGDSEGQATFLNKAWRDQTGREIEESLGERWTESLHPDDAPEVLAKWKRANERGEPYAGECRFKASDGSYRSFDFVGVPVRDQFGKITKWVGIDRDITDRKHAEKQIHDSRERLRSLVNRLDTMREEERTMIAREIHDQVGQALTILKMDLSWLVNKLPENQKAARGRASSMISVVETTLESVRDLSSRLRPAILDDLGLEAAIEWQAQEFTSRTGYNCKLDLRAGELGLSHDRDTTVFRILQEALTNVVRHAEASRVEISLQTIHNQLLLEVRDDGKGITREKLASGTSLGLIGMDERAATLGGEVDFCCPAEGGTVLSLRLPIAAERS